MKIQNDFFEVEIKPFGAELCSVRSLKNEREFIWQGDPQIWARHAPLLFPIVGRLVNHEYKLGDEVYRLNQHGFARDMEFAVIRWNTSETAFSLKSGLKTYEAYPFEFDFQVGYRLEGNTLHQDFTVINQDDEALPFSLGAHPAFNVTNIAQASIEFECEETMGSDTVVEGIRTGEMRHVVEGNMLLLTKNVFDRDALIYSNLNSNHVVLKEGGSDLVKVTFTNFPYLGIWSKPEANYVCIEPWYGIADKQGHDQNIWTKEGVLRLEPGQKFACSFAMTFFD